ncbi:MAG: hypothetical protein V9F04_05280 [Dermatophilaceae bacterium]
MIQDYENNAATPLHSFTFPSGTVIPANGVLVIHIGTGTDVPANLFFNTQGTSNQYSTGEAFGVVLKDAGSTVIDAISINTNVFNAASGVTASDWSGAGVTSASGGPAGPVRTATLDSNTAADWIGSSVSTPQTIGTFNPGYTNPNSGLVSGYAWTPSALLNDPTIANPLASNVTATTPYSVVVSSDNGCTTTANVTVTVGVGLPPSVTIAAGGATTFCGGGSVLLTSTVVDGCQPFTYAWSDGVNTVGTAATYSATTSGSYTVTVTDADNQVATSNAISVTVNPAPTATASSNSPVCVGHSA